MESQESSSFVRAICDQKSFLIPSSLVVELVSATNMAVSGYPLLRTGFLGVTNHRSTVVPLFDLAALMGGKSRLEKTEDLQKFLRQREDDHVSWLDELKRCAQTGNEFTKAIDPTQCAFGKWYEEVKTNRLTREKFTEGQPALEWLMDQFDIPHRRIHAIATEVLEAAKTDQTVAMSLIQRTWDHELSEMRKLFAQLFQTYRNQLCGVYVVLRLDGKPMALLVQSVPQVIRELPATQVCNVGDTLTVMMPDGQLSVILAEADLHFIVSVVEPAA